MLPIGNTQVSLNVPKLKRPTRYQTAQTGYHPGPLLLSPREWEVLQLTMAGKGNVEIATVLGIAVQNVKNHRTCLFRKYGVKSVTELLSKIISEKDEQIKQLKLHNNV